jgi:hypothetical protein
MLRTAIAAALAALSFQASAGLLSGADNAVRIDGFSHGYAAVDVTVDSFGTIGAGQLLGMANGSSFLTYCTDLFQSFSWGQSYTYSLVSNGAANGLTTTQADRLGKLYTVAGGPATNTTDSAAFQLAVWELLYDSTPGNVTTGDFRLNTGATTEQRNRANEWLTTALDPGATRSFNAQRLYSSVAQDFVVFTPLPIPSLTTGAVSEPAGYGLVVLAFGLLYLTRRRS